MTVITHPGLSRAATARDLVLRIVVVAGLAVSSYIHLHLAPLYRGVGNTITMADLFYVQGAVAALVTLVLLATGHRFAWWAAALIGVASFAAVMVYRYVDVGAIGPLPNMDDATWQPSPDKLLSAVAEAAVTGLVLIRFSLRAAAGRRAAGS